MDTRILIPTDFSKNAMNAVRYILKLYEKRHCEFYLLNVFHPEGYTTKSLLIPEPGSRDYEVLHLESEERLARLVESLKLQYDNERHRFHSIATFNYLSEAMKQVIAQKDIDMVVMGTQGASGSKGVIFGSNTVLAMEKVRECPILAVPEDYLFRQPKEIVFPTDFQADFKRRELVRLIEISKLYDAVIRVLHVTKNDHLKPVQQENKQLLTEILEEVDYSFHTLSGSDVAEGISTFVSSRNSDMIAFINRKHFFFGSIFSRPLVKEIGYDATTPILALH